MEMLHEYFGEYNKPTSKDIRFLGFKLREDSHIPIVDSLCMILGITKDELLSQCDIKDDLSGNTVLSRAIAKYSGKLFTKDTYREGITLSGSDLLLHLIDNGNTIIRTLYHGDSWLPIVGYIGNGCLDKDIICFYDSYDREIKQRIFTEVMDMWVNQEYIFLPS